MRDYREEMCEHANTLIDSTWTYDKLQPFLDIFDAAMEEAARNSLPASCDEGCDSCPPPQDCPVRENGMLYDCVKDITAELEADNLSLIQKSGEIMGTFMAKLDRAEAEAEYHRGQAELWHRELERVVAFGGASFNAGFECKQKYDALVLALNKRAHEAALDGDGDIWTVLNRIIMDLRED